MSVDFEALFEKGLSYKAFVDAYANDAQRGRWASVHEKVLLSQPQCELLSSFVRQMK